MHFRKHLSLDHKLSVLCSKRRVISGLGAVALASLLVFSILFSVGGDVSGATVAYSPSSLLSWFFSVPGNGSNAQGSPVEWGSDSEVAQGESLVGEEKAFFQKEALGSSSERATDGRSFGEEWGSGGRSSGNNTVDESNGLIPGGAGWVSPDANFTGVGNGNVSLNAGILEKSVEEGHAGKSSGNSTEEETNELKNGGAGIGAVSLDGNFNGVGNVSGSVSVNGGILEEPSGGGLLVNLTDKSIQDGKELFTGRTHMTNVTSQDTHGRLSVIGTREGKRNVTDFLDGRSSVSLSNGEAKESHEAPNNHQGSRPRVVSSGLQRKCDIFNGKWVRDENKPYYLPSSCPNVDLDFNCHNNGRPDREFLKWRWQPNDCDIPSLNATDFLRRLRGQRLIFVGDSLNRNMWESLVCILRHSVKKKRVYEMSGRNQFKTAGYYSFRFKDYGCSIDFVRSPFLVRELYPNSANGFEDEKLRLDVIDETTSAYREADIVVFNTGHWWTHEKTSRGINYYQEGNRVFPVLKVLEAYKKALSTWARWVDKNINPNKTQVVFRGYSLTHFSGGQWNSGGQCHKETEPIFNESFVGKYPVKMRALEQVLDQMKTPVIYLNISRLTDYRKDGHPSIYRKKYNSVEEQINAEKSQDCSHWCLPGVPDTWNELLYASLLMAGRGPWKN